MAHKKGAGSTDNGRDSKPKYLGIKMYGGQSARAGNILIRQRGTRWNSGENTYLGKDHTVHAKIDGIVTYTRGKNNKSTVHIMPFPGSVDEVLDVAIVKKAKAPKPVAAKPAPVAKPAAPVVAKVVERVVAPAPAPVVEKVVEAAPVVVERVVVVEPVVEKVVEAAPVVERVVRVAPAVEVRTVQSETEPVVRTASRVVSEESTPAVISTPKVISSTIVTPTTTAAKTGHTLPRGIKQDDHKIVEGIGPKIEGLLHEAGIKTWLELSQTPIERLKEILEAAGSRYQMHDPGTWPKQAQFAHEGRFEELKEWQDMLDGGKSPD
jgi:large subunit ribosomal protein L27